MTKKYIPSLINAVLFFFIIVLTISIVQGIIPELEKLQVDGDERLQIEDISEDKSLQVNDISEDKSLQVNDISEDKSLQVNDISEDTGILDAAGNLNLDVHDVREIRASLQEDIKKVYNLMLILEQKTAASKNLINKPNINSQTQHIEWLMSEITAKNEDNERLWQKSHQLQMRLRQLEAELEEVLVADAVLRAEDNHLRQQNNQLRIQLQQLQAKLQYVLGQQEKQHSTVQGKYAKTTTLLPKNLKQPVPLLNTMLNAIICALKNKLSNSITTEEKYGIISSGSNIGKNWNIWVEPSFFCANQQQYKQIQEYSAVINGIFIGANKQLNDRIIIGIIGAYLNLNAQYDSRILKKTKGTIYSLSLGSRYYFKKNLFVQGIIGFANYIGKNKYQYVYTPSAGMNNTSYYGNLIVGYHLISQPKLDLVPFIGIGSTYFGTSNCKLSNNIIIENSCNKTLEGIVGATIKYPIIHNNNNIKVETEFYGFVDYNMLDNCGCIYNTYYQLGTRLDIEYNLIKFGISYNAYLTKKYIAHAGMISIGTNF
ncbi:autotransporter beta-domain protein [Orientia chuto str. Dubai]|uniref:Autotransporter beta-domain protein n=1 Tax=Orientia chuto str. Dubai TaxID=1359168 RepID=A0A0F3MLF4_9RICK|nr:autotransporter outer membrane beta-barrel domain-containing protein [Candidatus Orientia mediorientalis]KJV55439.1 autotransporter beta-domain protein [Orientia chuto str. Dubai]